MATKKAAIKEGSVKATLADSLRKYKDCNGFTLSQMVDKYPKYIHSTAQASEMMNGSANIPLDLLVELHRVDGVDLNEFFTGGDDFFIPEDYYDRITLKKENAKTLKSLEKILNDTQKLETSLKALIRQCNSIDKSF